MHISLPAYPIPILSIYAHLCIDAIIKIHQLTY